MPWLLPAWCARGRQEDPTERINDFDPPALPILVDLVSLLTYLADHTERHALHCLVITDLKLVIVEDDLLAAHQVKEAMHNCQLTS